MDDRATAISDLNWTTDKPTKPVWYWRSGFHAYPKNAAVALRVFPYASPTQSKVFPSVKAHYRRYGSWYDPLDAAFTVFGIVLVVGVLTTWSSTK